MPHYALWKSAGFCRNRRRLGGWGLRRAGRVVV